MTSIEPDGGAINDVCIFRNSGLMLLALDNSQIPAHFIPALGPAPKWCSHLDNLTVRKTTSIGLWWLFFCNLWLNILLFASLI